mgnify:CR=1 FL=1
MNTLLIVVVSVVGFCYFGGNKCPKILKHNKEMLLGVLIGLALCSFMGVKLEGLGEVECRERISRIYDDILGGGGSIDVGEMEEAIRQCMRG